ncbi:MAG: alpha/beta hydrolase [Bacteroidota bacterium]
MKKIKKIVAWASLIILLGILALGFMNFHSDKSVVQLKEKYAYSDSRFMEIDGAEVHYRVSGVGPPLLLLHGTAASLHTWEGWTKELKDSFQIISVDLPAFGLTGPHPKRSYLIESYVKFVEQFVQDLSLERFHLAGNSLGGRIAWNYTLKNPTKVDRLILIDATGFLQEKERPLSFRLAQHDLGAWILLRFTPRALVHQSLREVYGKDELIEESLVDRYFEMLLRPGNRQAFIDRARTINAINVDRLKEIQQPTLIMWGALDEWVNPKDAFQFKERIPNTRIANFPTAGHVPMEEIPVLTAEVARQFLSSPTAAPDSIQ